MERAGAFLMQAEAENNLILGIAGGSNACARTWPESHYLATVEDDEGVVACAVRTPPYKAVITRGSGPAFELLADDLMEKYGRLPVVFGPEPGVSLLAEPLARQTGMQVRRGMQHRLFEAREVRAPEMRPRGALRVAGEADLSVVMPWAAAFFEEAHLDDPVEPGQVIRDRVRRRQLFIWDDGRPVSMAAWASRTPHGVRINFVYTPPEYRRRGYASGCVAALTQQLLNEGLTFCCLYADVANPTSNRIYQTLGYQATCDVSDVHLDVG
jgi:GNAT superfamily N-acetyltransferase